MDRHNRQAKREISETISAWSKDSNVKAIVLHGQGRLKLSHACAKCLCISAGSRRHFLYGIKFFAANHIQPTGPFASPFAHGVLGFAPHARNRTRHTV